MPRPTPKPSPKPAPKAYLIQTPAQLRALRSPARQEIIDAVQASGPCSIADLGASLGRKPDSLYYHIRTLLRLGLLVERDGPSLLIDVPGRPMRIRYQPADPANRRAIQSTVGAMLRLTARDFRAGFASPDAIPNGKGRNLWAARLKARLSPAQTARLSALLAQAVEVMTTAAPSPRSRLIALTFVTTPIPSRPTKHPSEPKSKRKASKGVST